MEKGNIEELKVTVEEKVSPVASKAKINGLFKFRWSTVLLLCMIGGLTFFTVHNVFQIMLFFVFSAYGGIRTGIGMLVLTAYFPFGGLGHLGKGKAVNRYNLFQLG